MNASLSNGAAQGAVYFGEVPRHWSILRLKHCVELMTINAVSRRFPVALEAIEGWTGRLQESVGIYEGLGTSFQKGDVLFGKLRPYLAKVWTAKRPGEAVGDFHVLRPNGILDPEFLKYWLLNPSFIDVMNGSTFGAKMPRVSWSFMGSTRICVPPLAEQQKIVSVIVDAEAGIDAFISDQEKLIELLKERRSATITQAVTRGLDPKVPLKDSGIEWLGDVPGHWGRTKVSRVARVGNGSTPSRERPDYWTNGELAWMNSSCVNEPVASKPNRFVTAVAQAECHLPIVPAGAILMGLTGQGKTRGAATKLGIEATISQHVAYIVFQWPMDPQFAYWAFKAGYEELRFISDGNGGTKGALTCDALGRFPLPVPPRQEQLAIASYLDREIAEIDAAIADAEMAIALSKERRAALISAAVTGKIDVRDAVVRDGELAEAHAQ